LYSGPDSAPRSGPFDLEIVGGEEERRFSDGDVDTSADVRVATSESVVVVFDKSVELTVEGAAAVRQLGYRLFGDMPSKVTVLGHGNSLTHGGRTGDARAVAVADLLRDTVVGAFERMVRLGVRPEVLPVVSSFRPVVLPGRRGPGRSVVIEVTWDAGVRGGVRAGGRVPEVPEVPGASLGLPGVPMVRPVPDVVAPPVGALAALMGVVPRGAVFEDPRGFVGLVNGWRGGAEPFGGNGVDATLAFLSTLHGVPRVAGGPVGVVPGPVAEMLSVDPELMGVGDAAVERVVRRAAGPGASGFVFGYGYSADRGRWFGQAWAVVRFGAEVLFVDAVAGTVVPAVAGALPGLGRVYAVVVDERGSVLTDESGSAYGFGSGAEGSLGGRVESGELEFKFSPEEPPVPGPWWYDHMPASDHRDGSVPRSDPFDLEIDGGEGDRWFGDEGDDAGADVDGELLRPTVFDPNSPAPVPAGEGAAQPDEQASAPGTRDRARDLVENNADPVSLGQRGLYTRVEGLVRQRLEISGEEAAADLLTLIAAGLKVLTREARERFGPVGGARGRMPDKVLRTPSDVSAAAARLRDQETPFDADDRSVAAEIVDRTNLGDELLERGLYDDVVDLVAYERRMDRKGRLVYAQSIGFVLGTVRPEWIANREGLFAGAADRGGPTESEPPDDYFGALTANAATSSTTADSAQNHVLPKLSAEARVDTFVETLFDALDQKVPTVESPPWQRQRRMPETPSLEPSVIQSTYGISARNQERIQKFADRFNIVFDARPSNPMAWRWETAGALPKPVEIKSKTINELDLHLGMRQETVGLVGYFDPVAPPASLPGDVLNAAKARFNERKTEFNNLADTMAALEESGDFQVVNGIVHQATPHGYAKLTSDTDIFNILGEDGAQLGEVDYERVVWLMRHRGMNVMHGAHAYWTPKNAFEQTIYDDIVAHHRKTPLVRFLPHAQPYLVYADNGQPVSEENYGSHSGISTESELLAVVPPGTSFVDPARFVGLLGGSAEPGEVSWLGREVPGFGAALAFESTWRGVPRVAGSITEANSDVLGRAPEFVDRGPAGVTRVVDVLAGQAAGASAVLRVHRPDGSIRALNVVRFGDDVMVVDAVAGTAVAVTEEVASTLVDARDLVYAHGFTPEGADIGMAPRRSPASPGPDADEYELAEFGRARAGAELVDSASSGGEVPVPGTGGRLVQWWGGLVLVGGRFTPEMVADLATTMWRDVIWYFVGPEGEEPRWEVFRPVGRPLPVKVSDLPPAARAAINEGVAHADG
jgi:hypothetical protein